jgi:transmembrane sensor
MGMSAESDDLLREDARLWAIRVSDPAFADWDAFAAWLEQDPAHNAAYEAALDDLEGVDALFDVSPAPIPFPAPVQVGPAHAPRRWRMPAAAVGVALLAAGGSWLALDHRAQQEYATAAGEHRTVELADGSRIVLNGGTRLTFDPARPREIAMAQGEALFEVHHDQAHPFVVTTKDGTRLVDVGTVFNVVKRGAALDVAVAEGAVDYRGGGAVIRLAAGDMLTRASATAAPVKRSVDPGAVGGWRTGLLQFTDAPLRTVAEDLARNLGRPVAIDEALASRRFSGTIVVDGAPDAVMARVAPLLGVRIERDGAGWRITRPDGPPR